MRRFRFHIGTLVILVLLLGVSFAALRESNQIWDSSVFSMTLVMLSISILLAVHRTEKRRAFWLGFALLGSVYLLFTLVPSIESRLITTKALHYLDSKVTRSIPAGLAYFDYDNDGLMDLFVVKNSEPNVLILNQGNGTWEHVVEAGPSNPPDNQARSPWQRLLRTPLNGSNGTTEHFMRIGHSLVPKQALCINELKYIA
jgi:D-alanyl-lipoteichoic acid acyltransferase DltB (MBOAT superfamily)